MNILVVGANSLLGRNLVTSLSENHHVYACVRSKETIKFIHNSNITVIESDLAKFDVEILPKNIDAIYYVAQSNKFREFPNGSEDMTEINILTPIKIATWGSEHQVKIFVYASTGGVYTQTENIVHEIDNINTFKLNGFYPSSKICAEILLKSFENLFDAFIIARPFFMYGVNQTSTMLIPRLISNIQNGNPITLNNTEGIKINPIYISDAVKAFENMLKLQGSHLFNIAGKEILSLKEICLIISDVMGKKTEFIYNEQSANDLIGNTDLMNKYLGTSQITFKEGILKMLERI